MLCNMLYDMLCDILCDMLCDMLYDMLCNILYNMLYDMLCNILYDILCNILYDILCNILYDMLCNMLYDMLCNILYDMLCNMLYDMLCNMLYDMLCNILYNMLCNMLYDMLCNILYNMHVVHLSSFKIRQCLKANCAVCYEFCETGIGKIILVTPPETPSMDCQHLECPSQTFIIPYTLLVHGLISKGCNNIRTISFLFFLSMCTAYELVKKLCECVMDFIILITFCKYNSIRHCYLQMGLELNIFFQLHHCMD